MKVNHAAWILSSDNGGTKGERTKIIYIHFCTKVGLMFMRPFILMYLVIVAVWKYGLLRQKYKSQIQVKCAHFLKNLFHRQATRQEQRNTKYEHRPEQQILALVSKNNNSKF